MVLGRDLVAYGHLIRRHAPLAKRMAVLWGAADEALDAVRRDRLLAGVRLLPAELREVVVCRYLLELSEKETATALGLRAGTVKSRLHRALGRRREEVAGG